MIDSFIAELKRRGKSELTIRQVKSNLGHFILWMQNNNPLPTPQAPLEDGRQATEIDILNFKKSITRNYKPATVRQTLTHLRAYFNYLVSQGVIPDNPVHYISAPIVVKTAPKWLSRNEQNSLIRAIRKHGSLRDLTLVTFLLHTGLRVQEICNVKVSDITMGDRKGIVKVLGKWNRYREVPLNADVRKILARYLGDYADEYLFTNRQGQQMTTRAAQLIIEKYRKLTQIEHLTAHSLRHTFCHELIQRKVPMDVVARLAGHCRQDGSPNIMQTLVYTQPGQDDLQRAVEELSWL
jgi:integrase/recombinase XerC/integrase/recombinase XerD